MPLYTPAAASSSGNGRYDPMALRSGQSASALDEVWSATGVSLPVLWTANANWPPTAFDVNTTKPGHLYVRQATNSTALFAGLQAIPAGDFVIQMPVFVSPNVANLSHSGLVLSDGTGGSANCLIAVNYQSGANGGSSAGIQGGTFANITANTLAPMLAALNPLIVRIERASGSYTIELSPDGIAGQRKAVTPSFTPTHFGFTGTAWTSGTELRSAFGAFRYSATATTRWGAYL